MNRRQFLRATALAAAALPIAPCANAATGSAIRPDRDGMLRVNGKREFILGLYQVPKGDSSLREASEAGFNLINRSATRAAYDEAHALVSGVGARWVRFRQRIAPKPKAASGKPLKR